MLHNFFYELVIQQVNRSHIPRCRALNSPTNLCFTLFCHGTPVSHTAIGGLQLPAWSVCHVSVMAWYVRQKRSCCIAPKMFSNPFMQNSLTQSRLHSRAMLLQNISGCLPVINLSTTVLLHFFFCISFHHVFVCFLLSFNLLPLQLKLVQPLIAIASFLFLFSFFCYFTLPLVTSLSDKALVLQTLHFYLFL